MDSASPATTEPVVAGGSVVTGAGQEVDGRDPATGDVLWSYARDLDLCGVTSVYSYAVAVYPDARGCGQVSTIDGKTGTRGPTRTAYADPEVRLSTDGTTVLSAGDSRLEQWRSDMVRMNSYGALDARIKPDVPAQPLCRLVSAAASPSAVSVHRVVPPAAGRAAHPAAARTRRRTSRSRSTSRCPGVPADSDAQVIAVSDTTTAVYLPTPKPTVNVIDETGTTIVQHAAAASRRRSHATASRAGDLVTWWTGDSVMVFEANGLHYKYTVSAVGGQAPGGSRDDAGGQAAGARSPPDTTCSIPQTGAGREPHSS